MLINKFLRLSELPIFVLKIVALSEINILNNFFIQNNYDATLQPKLCSYCNFCR